MTEEDLVAAEEWAGKLGGVTGETILGLVAEVRALGGCRCVTLDELEGGGTDPRSCPEHAFAAGVAHGTPPVPPRRTLVAIRHKTGKSQGHVAQVAGMHQGDASDIERRADYKVSSLHRYAKGLDGTCQVLFHVKDHGTFEVVPPAQDPK